MMRMIALRPMAMATTRVPSNTMITSRYLSSQGMQAVENLRHALEEYRKVHYRQCLPSRFKKDLIKAAKKDETSDHISLVDLQQVIENIRMQHKISPQEVQTIFQEMGDSGKISADKFLKII